VELVPVLGIMTIQAPPVVLVVLEDDFGMEPGQFPSFSVHRHHAMAVGARENAGRKWGRGYFEDFLDLGHPGLGKGRRSMLLHGLRVLAGPSGKEKTKEERTDLRESRHLGLPVD
jgi:hypothetical protein